MHSEPKKNLLQTIWLSATNHCSGITGFLIPFLYGSDSDLERYCDLKTAEWLFEALGKQDLACSTSDSLTSSISVLETEIQIKKLPFKLTRGL